MIKRPRNKNNNEILFYQSWGDMVALLLVFFVFLFSMSTLDVVKFKQLTSSFPTIFNVKYKEKLIEEYEEEQKIIEKLYYELANYIEAEQLSDDVSVKIEKHTIVMDLGSKLLFEVADADLRQEAQRIILAFVQYFKQVEDAKIVVEGHTDDIPISKPKYPSNWELSAGRAASVVRFLADHGIPEKNCYIIGYNQFNALFPNDSEENRAKNRRVRIIFQPVVKKDSSEADFSAVINEDNGTEILDVTKNLDEVIVE